MVGATKSAQPVRRIEVIEVGVGNCGEVSRRIALSIHLETEARGNFELSFAPPRVLGAIGSATARYRRLFARDSLELGYQLIPNLSVSGFLDYISNVDLAAHNAGLTDAGARFGFKF